MTGRVLTKGCSIVCSANEAYWHHSDWHTDELIPKFQNLIFIFYFSHRIVYVFPSIYCEIECFWSAHLNYCWFIPKRIEWYLPSFEWRKKKFYCPIEWKFRSAICMRNENGIFYRISNDPTTMDDSTIQPFNLVSKQSWIWSISIIEEHFLPFQTE